MPVFFIQTEYLLKLAVNMFNRFFIPRVRTAARHQLG